MGEHYDIRNGARQPRGLLVRVGIDATAGKWNGPCDFKDGSFCFVPIPEGNPSSPNYDHLYNEFAPFAERFGQFPSRLLGKACHLDPDFHNLTYGDGGQRANRIATYLRNSANTDPTSDDSSRDDFLVFWAGLRPISAKDDLICAIIGFYRVAVIKRAIDIPSVDCHRNAHTRYGVADDSNEVVVFASPTGSGRLTKYIDIGKSYPCGETQQLNQCVHPHLLKEWGGLMSQDEEDIKNGYIQRSNALPIFRDPDRFLGWFQSRNPQLIHTNNI